jgi:hypothetical protein
MKNKNITKGNMFGKITNKRLLKYVKSIEFLLTDNSQNNQLNSKIVGKIINTNILVKINGKNISAIITKHGYIDITGLILTINVPDRIVSSKGKSAKEILNFIKFSAKGFQIASAVRINGFAIITHFERRLTDYQTKRRTQQYLNSLLNRGSLLYSSEKTADLLLITDKNQYPPSEP